MKKMKSLPAIAVQFILGLVGIAILVLISVSPLLPQEWYLAELFSGTKEVYTSLDTAIRSVTYAIVVVFIEQPVLATLGIIARKSKRTVTVCDMLGNVVKYLVLIIVFMLVLSAFGVNTAALVAGAGVLSLIIGLGCQSIIADVLAGIFFLFEGSFKVGDIVVVSGFRGTVQHIGVRTTSIVDATGNIKIINNSAITDLINNTKELSVAVITCSVDYAIPMERVEAVIDANLQYMHDQIPQIIEGPTYLGVDALADSGVVVKLIAKCTEMDKFAVQRAMNREIKVIFDANDITIPFPQVTLNQPVPVSTAEPVKLVSTKVREVVVVPEKKTKEKKGRSKVVIEEKSIATPAPAQEGK